MDVLVNFSELINKDRKDLSSWKAACSAVNNMMRIYPECFSTQGDSFAPLRVHANVGSIDGVDTHKLEVFLAKFLLVLDNEVKIEKVDFSGEERFIKAGEQAAYCADIKGGIRHNQWTDNRELLTLGIYVHGMMDSFSQEQRRLLYHGQTLNELPSYIGSVETLSRALSIEFTVGGDRFNRFDISCALNCLQNNNTDVLKEIEKRVRKELSPALKSGIISPEFLDKEINVWIKNNDLKKDHLGKVFDQYSDKSQKKEIRKKPSQVYQEMLKNESKHKTTSLKKS